MCAYKFVNFVEYMRVYACMKKQENVSGTKYWLAGAGKLKCGVYDINHACVCVSRCSLMVCTT